VCIVDLAVPGELDLLVLGLVLTTALAVPVSIGIAILRWHLYDLDRLVNRALVYGVLTGCVLAVYTAVVLGLGIVVRDRSLAVALVATAAVAIAVNPLRLVLQRAVDRLMYGDRRDPSAGLTRLAERLEATIAPQTALRTIVDTVADSLKVPFVAVDLVRSGRAERMATHGTPGGRDPLTVPLVFQGEPVGQLVVESRGAGDPFNAADRRLLDQLARHAGPVVHAIRLTADLQRSRERLVRAQEEERRRIRRDLHDGLGPVLATAVFQVDDARDVVSSDPARADQQMAALRTTLQDAVADIRRLVYALRPPALDELGLAPALAEEVARFNAHGSGPRITLDLREALPILPAAIEVAAYRIALEAVTNAVRHSGADACSVTLGINGGLELEIRDDGVGLGAGAHGAGVGIASMSERASELGGALRVERRRGGGTLVHATLPLDVP
jgi:signal transduction histidine kinase